MMHTERLLIDYGNPAYARIAHSGRIAPAVIEAARQKAYQQYPDAIQDPHLAAMLELPSLIGMMEAFREAKANGVDRQSRDPMYTAIMETVRLTGVDEADVASLLGSLRGLRPSSTAVRQL